MDNGDDAERGPRCTMLWVENAADLIAMIRAGCRLAATVRRHGDGAQRAKYCGGNGGKMRPADLPGWIMFWIDGEGESEQLVLNRFGYRSAAILRCAEIRDVTTEEPSCEAAAGQTLDEAVAEKVLDDGQKLDVVTVTPRMTLQNEIHDNGWPAQEESVDTTAGCDAMSCVIFTSEMCCGSCSIM